MKREHVPWPANVRCGDRALADLVRHTVHVLVSAGGRHSTVIVEQVLPTSRDTAAPRVPIQCASHPPISEEEQKG